MPGTLAEARPQFFSTALQKEASKEAKGKFSAFGEIFFIREFVNESGEQTKKIAAVTIAYPAGVRFETVREILREAQTEAIPVYYEWDGEKEGKLIALAQRVPDVMDNLWMLDRFVEASARVISQKFPKEKRPDAVKHYFAIQREREAFLEEMKKDIAEVLRTPDFLMRTPFNPRYEGKGMYLLEMRQNADGVWEGIDTKGEVVPMVSMASDVSHASWLRWREVANKERGDTIGFHGDDTETVDECGGSKRCSIFFELMEGSEAALEELLKSDLSDYQKALILQTIYGSKKESSSCASCGKTTSACECKSNYLPL